MKEILKDSLFYLSSPILNKICKFKDKHKGEACYIFGDGTSIKYFDLSLFSDKIGIAMNYMPFHNDFQKLNVTYCVITAPYFFSPVLGYSDPVFKKYLYKMSKFYTDVIDNNTDKSFFINLSNYPFIRRSNVYYNFRKYPEKYLPSNFISKYTECFNGVMRNSISMAIYMGFSDIYLVGCDYTFSPTQHYHWYEKGEGELFDKPDYERTFLTLAKEYANITTVTLNGTSKLLNFISYENLKGVPPKFKENTEIISGKYLEGLKTWTGFKMI